MRRALQGVDQLAEVIRKIKEDPTDRRIVMSAWNAADLDAMALPPCHLLCQFYVEPARRELSCAMYQRSCDLGLGVPFNIASYALLTRLIAQARTPAYPHAHIRRALALRSGRLLFTACEHTLSAAMRRARGRHGTRAEDLAGVACATRSSLTGELNASLRSPAISACAQVCNLEAAELFHVLGDAHVYSNHVKALETQLQNAPRAFPTLRINPAVNDIDGFAFSDFEIVDYYPHRKIAMDMAV